MAVSTIDALYNGGSEKISATSTGVDVTGTLTSDGLTLNTLALPSAGTATIFNRNTDSSLYIQTSSGNTVYLLDGSQNTMYAAAPTSHSFAISNTERMRIDSSGNLLVGTTSTPNLGTAHVLVGSSSQGGAGATLLQNTSGVAGCPVLNLATADTSTDSTNRFMQFYGAYTGGAATAMGGIVGNGAGNVAFATLSDAREKENITPVVSAADKIAQIEVVAFDFIKSKEHVKYGFIAQDVLPVFPEFVVSNMSNEGEEKRLGLTGGMSSGYIAVLTAALQEALTKIDDMETRLAALEG